jgi:hypothetical protein
MDEDEQSTCDEHGRTKPVKAFVLVAGLLTYGAGGQPCGECCRRGVEQMQGDDDG